MIPIEARGCAKIMGFGVPDINFFTAILVKSCTLSKNLELSIEFVNSENASFYLKSSSPFALTDSP